MASNVTVPQCAAHVSAREYNSQAAASFDLTAWPYYKGYVTSAQVLPGIIIGGLCWVVALVFVIWLLTLCCRSVGWRSRRTRVHDVPAEGRNKWAVFNILLLVVALGVIGTSTWALVEGIKTTDGKVNDFWTLISDLEDDLQNVSNTIQTTSDDTNTLQSSLTSATTLLSDATNAALATAAGLDVPAILSSLSGISSQLTSGRSSALEAQNNIQGQGIVQLENLQNKYQHKTEDAWKTWRIVVVAVFFGLLILFGVVCAFLALLDRTPRLTATFTLFLWIWVGFVLLLGAGALNVVWRVSRDGCLYGVSYAATQISTDSNTQNVVNYYFGRTYVAPQDVSQQLFKVNLTAIAGNLTNPDVANFIAASQTSAGQAVIARANAADQTNVNALQPRITDLLGNITALDSQIQASAFSREANGLQDLVCCGMTNAVWNLWLASVITGAVAGLLAVLALIKVVTAIHPLGTNQHYYPHSPNGAITSRKYGAA